MKNERRPGRPLGTTAPKSDAVKRVREALAMTQEQFARDLGCTASTVYKMEADERLPSKATIKQQLEKLAKRAGVTIGSE